MSNLSLERFDKQFIDYY